jgi:hypothetical protein
VPGALTRFGNHRGFCHYSYAEAIAEERDFGDKAAQKALIDRLFVLTGLIDGGTSSTGVAVKVLLVPVFAATIEEPSVHDDREEVASWLLCSKTATVVRLASNESCLAGLLLAIITTSAATFNSPVYYQDKI